MTAGVPSAMISRLAIKSVGTQSCRRLATLRFWVSCDLGFASEAVACRRVATEGSDVGSGSSSDGFCRHADRDDGRAGRSANDEPITEGVAFLSIFDERTNVVVELGGDPISDGVDFFDDGIRLHH